MEQDIKQIQEFLGISNEQALFQYELSGYNVDMAIQMYLENGQNGQNDQNNIQKSIYPDWYEIFWEKNTEIPQSWLKQTLKFNNELGIIQLQNGPCGMLSAIQATIILECMENPNFNYKYQVKTEDIINAIKIILMKCKAPNDTEVKLAKWKDKQYINIDLINVKTEKICDFINNNIQSYTQEGCLILIMYSAVFTRSIELVKQDVYQSNGDFPLIKSNFNICTTDLIMLLLNGKADGNIGAYDHLGNKFLINQNNQIGILSTEIQQIGVPLNDSLLSPNKPIWIIHGGDHFSVLFGVLNQYSHCYNLPTTIQLYHWNGLKPGGPRMAHIQLKLTQPPNIQSPSTYKEYQKFNSYYKPQPLEIESIIQADNEDKKKYKNQYWEWKYEVQLAFKNDEVEGNERPIELNEPKYQLGEIPKGNWRCVYCYYRRFQTMNFGINQKGEQCQHCFKNIQECGWTIWLHYNQISKSFQKVIKSNYADKIINVIHSKWPNSIIQFLDQEFPSSI